MKTLRKNVSTVAIVGTGVIGASWAAYFLSRGMSVRATDPSPGAEQRLREAVDRHWPGIERIGVAEGASRDKLVFCADLEDALADVDFVQENGPENESLKMYLFKRIDRALPAEVVIASSSSGLLMSRVQSVCRFPERVVLGHPFNPPHLVPLVEVVGGQLTSPDVVQFTMGFYASIGKRPIHPRKEVKGHIANRLQAALWREAFHLVDQGVATVADIDTAISHGPGLRWALLGPFLNLHLSGGQGGVEHVLEHLGPPIETWWADLGSPTLTPALKENIATGVRELLTTRQQDAMVEDRDALLVDLIAAKTQSESLP